jgi:alanine racemase
VAARALCPDARVLVMGGVFAGQGADVVRHGLTVAAWEAWQLDELEKAAGGTAGGLAVHLEIDTGMSRQGVGVDGLGRILARFGAGSMLRLEGVMTHLFAADEADGAVTAEQMARLDEVLARINAAGHLPDWLNVGNSAALLAGRTGEIAALAGRHGLKAMLRPGLALYGLAPRFEPDGEEPACLAAARERLKPVMSWKSAVVGVRTVEAGAVVGYNGTFVATERMRLALVAVGYGDGLERLLGNRFSLLVRGERAPVVGRISMDQTVLDVTEIAGVEVGDEVVIVGTQGGETISAFDHAEVEGTIPWEVFTRISGRVRRNSF